VIPYLLFYDGHCGLCHRAVKFVLASDAKGLFRFAPLQGETFGQKVPENVRETLPDSLVLLTPDGRLHVKSDGTVEMLKVLGGSWAFLGLLLKLVPRPLRDFGYDIVARVRHRLFARPSDACPVVPAELRSRFLP
jgi:predicted DCC family thiol-disulfide oxidoreductase YuxK